MSKDMTGSMFAVTKRSDTDPVKIGCINIDGVKIDMVIYDKEISQRGRQYNPIRLHYPMGHKQELQAVNI